MKRDKKDPEVKRRAKAGARRLREQVSARMTRANARPSADLPGDNTLETSTRRLTKHKTALKKKSTVGRNK